MKLTVKYELEISPENEALIPVIAGIEGWTPDHNLTAQEYINLNVTTPRVKPLFESLIFSAVDAYFGIAMKAQSEAVKTAYAGANVITSEFTNA
jgi:hypothetical protein